MRKMPDTSVLVPILFKDHEMHIRCLSWLNRLIGVEDELVIASHSLAEVYSTLTRMPIRPPLRPADVWQSIQTNLLAHGRTVFLTDADYIAILSDVAASGIRGGTVYDALIVAAARKANIDQIVTLNTKHFRLIAPDLLEKLVEP